MKVARTLLLLGIVTAILVIASGGRFHIGIPIAILLTLLLCALEPSIAKE